MDKPSVPPPPPEDGEGGGRLAENIMHFARALRAAGIPIGPGRVLDAVRAVGTVGLASRDDFYWTLHAVFIHRRDRGHLVPDEADPVDGEGILVFVRGAEEVIRDFRGVLGRDHGLDPRQPLGPRGVDLQDAGVRMRTPQNLPVKHPGKLDVERIPGLSREENFSIHFGRALPDDREVIRP